MSLYAEKGEHITCENGHVICTVAHDIAYGQIQDPPNDFEDWKQEEPKRGSASTVIRCEICGAPWFAGNGIYHIEDRWTKPLYE